MLLRFHGVGAEPEQIRHPLGTAKIGGSEMVRWAKHLGLKARARRQLKEPGDVEASREIERSDASCHQHEASVPLSLKLPAIHRLRPWRARTLNERLVFACLADNQETTGAQRGDPFGPVQCPG